MQLLHAGSGEFLAARLKYGRSSGSTLYELGLDSSMPDPYCEGSADSWLTIVPATAGRVLGEIVRWGDDVAFVSSRWDWPCSVPGIRVSTSTATSTEYPQSAHVSSWRVVQYASGKDTAVITAGSQSSDADVAVCMAFFKLFRRSSLVMP